ncbi:cell cycle checkpoint protein [Sarotherodon galilaeus]
MTGGLGGGQSEPARPDITQVSPACELAEFVACALSNLKLCEGSREALKRCMSANGNINCPFLSLSTGLSLEDLL